MTLTPVQSAGAHATSGTVTATLPGALTTGNWLAAFVGDNSTSTNLSSTPSGSGWVPIVAPFQSGSSTCLAGWLRQIQSGDGTSWTYTPGGGSSFDLHVIECPAMSNPGVDKIATANSGASAVTSQAVGPTAGLTTMDELGLAVCYVNVNISATSASGLTVLQSTHMITAWKEDTDESALSTTFGWTTAGKAIAAILALNPSVPLVSPFVGWGIPA